MFLSKIIVIIITLFSIAFTCHTNKGKLDNVNSGMLCDFVNVTEHESFSRHPTKKKYIYLNASKSNIGVLPCYRGDLVNNQLSYFSTPVSDSDLLNQVNNSASIVNSPFECQSICQYWDECKYFTYKLDTKQCWIIISDVPVEDSGQIQNSSFISGPKYCTSLTPLSKGGFEIKIKAWLGRRKSYNQKWIGFTTEAWKGCKRICSINKNCIWFDYCFDGENENNELFTCYFRGLQESSIETPKYCVKSVKKNCSEING